MDKRLFVKLLVAAAQASEKRAQDHAFNASLFLKMDIAEYQKDAETFTRYKAAAELAKALIEKADVIASLIVTETAIQDIREDHDA